MSLSISSPNTGSYIAIFLPSLNGGGAERVMVTLANAFASRGYSVDLVLLVAKGPYLSQVSKDVRIVELNAGRMITALWPLMRYLLRERPVVMLSAMTHANVIAILAKMLSRVPTRVVVSERSTISVDSRVSKGIIPRLLYTSVPRLYSLANAIVAVSQASAVDLIRFAGLHQSLVNVIYNPFDLPSIQTKASESLEHPWFAPGQPAVILAIGRLTEQKNFSSLIRVYARLRKRIAARLLILGEGELRGALESLIAKYGLTADDVQLSGFVSNPFTYLARCSVFVLSSRWEGLPGVLIEAMACNAPVVSTDCPSGPEEILEGGRWGILVPLNDEDSLLEGIELVLSTPREQLPNVRERAADFERDKAVDAYLKVLGLQAQVGMH